MIHQLKSERHLFKKNKLQQPQEESSQSPLPSFNRINKTDQKRDEILSQAT